MSHISQLTKGSTTDDARSLWVRFRILVKERGYRASIVIPMEINGRIGQSDAIFHINSAIHIV